MTAWVSTLPCKCGKYLGDVLDTAEGGVFVHARPILKTVVEDGRGFPMHKGRPDHPYPELHALDRKGV